MSSLEYFAKGGGGGGHSSSARSAPKSSPSKSGTTKSQQNSSNKQSSNSTSKPAAPKTTATPSKDTKTTTTAKKPTSSVTKNTGKHYSDKAYVVGDGYTPRFSNGYSAPAGSAVYYPQHSFVDYLPWIYLFSQNSPRNDQTIVVQPDGKEVTARPEPQGVDGMLIFNWFLLILIAVAIVGGVVWFVNKRTKKS